jgi:hypothetical protein
MHLIIYGDFNCPFSALASARADVLVERRVAEVEWRPVEHDRNIADPSEAVEGTLAALLDREVAEVRDLVRPGEAFSITRPPVLPNTRRAVAAFASAPWHDDDDTRSRLFEALWRDGRDIGNAAEVDELAGGGFAACAPLVAAWRTAWVDHKRPVVPMLVLPDGYVSRGLGVLARLADLAATGSRRRVRRPAGVAT